LVNFGVVCQRMAFKYFNFFVLLLCGVNTLAAEQAGAPDKYRLWAGGSSPARLGYETKLIELLLAESENRFGPYELDVHSVQYSRFEGLKRIEDGRFDFALVPQWDQQHEKKTQFISVPYPIWNGFLGYRQLIVHRDRLDDFSKIRSLADLKKFKVGQGENWLDNSFYRKNGVRVIEAQTFHSLFPMLKRKRFDCVPLGINEVDGTLKEINSLTNEFVIVPKLMLHYPFYTYLVVGREEEKLANRLSSSFESIIVDGRYKALLEAFMSEKLRIIEDPNTVLIEIR